MAKGLTYTEIQFNKFFKILEEKTSREIAEQFLEEFCL